MLLIGGCKYYKFLILSELCKKYNKYKTYYFLLLIIFKHF